MVLLMWELLGIVPSLVMEHRLLQGALSSFLLLLHCHTSSMLIKSHTSWSNCAIKSNISSNKKKRCCLFLLQRLPDWRVLNILPELLKED